MLNCIAVGLGGFIGSVLRYLAGKIPLPSSGGFPASTLAVNVLGSFAIGLLAALAAKHSGFSPRLLLFMKAGVCGGFTTFSTFSLESLELIRAGACGTAAAYMLLSAALGVLAAALAMALVK